MSKATSRAIRKQLEAKAVERRQAEEDAKGRRLNGFKPATSGDMVAAISQQISFQTMTGQRG